MQKRMILSLLCILFSLMGFSTSETDNGSAVRMDIWLQVRAVVPSLLNAEIPHAPMAPIKIGINGHTLYLYGQFNELQIEVKDGDNVVYALEVADGAECVTLPENITGEYTLEMSDARYVYSCEITLE